MSEFNRLDINRKLRDKFLQYNTVDFDKLSNERVKDLLDTTMVIIEEHLKNERRIV